jgi:hypothetical protein
VVNPASYSEARAFEPVGIACRRTTAGIGNRHVLRKQSKPFTCGVYL